MSIANLRIDSIYYAIETLKSAAERASWNARGIDERDRAREMKRIAEEAAREYSALSAAMPRLRDLSAAADRDYGRYVTRDREPEADCCSCHLSAPCSFCTREADEEDQSSARKALGAVHTLTEGN